MENDDVSVRVNTIHKIPIVTTLMSFESIKNQLIPYLEGKSSSNSGLTKKEDDEVVFAIAEELANVGYSATFIQSACGSPPSFYRVALPLSPLRP